MAILHGLANNKEQTMSISVALPSSYVQQLGELIDDLGANFAACLQAAGLHKSELEQPLFRCSWEKFEALLAAAVAATSKPELGLLLGERLLVHTHGVLGYATMNAATLHEALRTLEQFIRVRAAFMQLAYDACNARLQLSSDIPLGQAERLLMEAILLALKQIIDFITRDKGAVVGVQFHYPAPAQAQLVQQVYGTKVGFAAPFSGLLIKPEHLHQPLRVVEPSAYAMAQQLCEQALAEIGDEPTLSQRIQRYLLTRHNEFPTLEQVCRQLHTTPRTLHRRLANENTSFRDITDTVKHRLAQQYLGEAQHSLQEVAYSLGYSDVSNFRRAFKRWEGVTPSQFAARAKP